MLNMLRCMRCWLNNHQKISGDATRPTSSASDLLSVLVWMVGCGKEHCLWPKACQPSPQLNGRKSIYLLLQTLFFHLLWIFVLLKTKAFASGTPHISQILSHQRCKESIQIWFAALAKWFVRLPANSLADASIIQLLPMLASLIGTSNSKPLIICTVLGRRTIFPKALIDSGYGGMGGVDHVLTNSLPQLSTNQGCNAIMSACEKGQQWTYALGRTSWWKKGTFWFHHVPHIATFFGGTHMFMHLLLRFVAGLLFQMPLMHLLPDVVSFNASISACEWQLASLLLTFGIALSGALIAWANHSVHLWAVWRTHWHDMFRSFCKCFCPSDSWDALSHDLTFSSTGTTGQDFGFAIHAPRSHMEASHVSADLKIFNAMITAYGSGSQWELALSTLREASRFRHMPDVIRVSTGSLFPNIYCVSFSPDALRSLQSLQHLKIILSRSRIWNDLDISPRIFCIFKHQCSLQQLEPSGNPWTFMLLLPTRPPCLFFGWNFMGIWCLKNILGIQLPS